jgi:predicted  nucleic acid-binding Zn-ribbon protein
VRGPDGAPEIPSIDPACAWFIAIITIAAEVGAAYAHKRNFCGVCMNNSQCSQCGAVFPDYSIQCPQCGGRPQAVVKKTPTEVEADFAKGDTSLPFFAVGTFKFLILMLTTFGAYSFYWSYRNWKQFRDARNEDLSPITRALISGITYFMLTSEIEKLAKQKRVQLAVYFPWVGIAYFAGMAAQRLLPEDLAIFGMLLPAPLLLPAQQAILRLSEGYPPAGGKVDETFTGASFLAIALGLGMGALAFSP